MVAVLESMSKPRKPVEIPLFVARQMRIHNIVPPWQNEVDISPIKEPSIRDRTPSKSIFLLTHQILDDFAFLCKNRHRSLHLRFDSLSSKFRWNEPLYSSLHRGIDRGLGGIHKVRVEDADDSVLTLEGIDKLLFGIAAVDRDDFNVRGELGFGAFPG